MKTAQEKLEHAIEKFTSSWFDGLIKSWKTEYNKKGLKSSYEIIAELAIKAHTEQQANEIKTSAESIKVCPSCNIPLNTFLDGRLFCSDCLRIIKQT